MRRSVNRLSLSLIALAVLLTFTGCGRKEVVEPDPADPVQRERFRLIAKVKQVTGKKRADLSGQIAADLDNAIQAGVDAQYKIGSNLTDTGNAYRLYWVEQTFVFEEYDAADASWEEIEPNSVAYLRRRADPQKPNVPTFTQQQTFARGLPWFISDASVGEPPGTVVYGHKIPLKFRLRRAAKGVPAEIAFNFPTTSGSATLRAYPELSNAPPDQELNQTLYWTRGLSPGSTVHAVLVLIEVGSQGIPGGGQPKPLSNPVVVSFRVAVNPPAGK